MQGRGHSTHALVCNVILETGIWSNGKLDLLIDATTKSGAILCSIETIGVVSEVVDTVATRAIRCDFEFLCAISKCHGSENPEEESNCFGGDIFDSTDIDCLSCGGRD